MLPEKRYFLTVYVGRYKKRGVFVSKEGLGFSKSEEEGPHTEEEFWNILGLFELILKPESTLLTEEELHEHRWFKALPEYSYQYGIALKENPDEGK